MKHDIEGLPPELLKELTLKTHQSETKTRLLDVLGADEGINVNEMLIRLWKEHKKVYKRAAIKSAVTELKKSGAIKRVRMGYYSKVVEAKEVAANDEKTAGKPCSGGTVVSIAPSICEYCAKSIKGKVHYHDDKPFCGTLCARRFEKDLE